MHWHVLGSCQYCCCNVAGALSKDQHTVQFLLQKAVQETVTKGINQINQLLKFLVFCFLKETMHIFFRSIEVINMYSRLHSNKKYKHILNLERHRHLI